MIIMSLLSYCVYVVHMQIIFVSSEKEKESFIKEIGGEILPEENGGQSKLIAVQDVIIHSQINDPMS